MTSEFYERDTVKLLSTYDVHDDAKEAAEKLVGEKRLASERDATVVIYNLFGIPSWGNFHRLGMYNLVELKGCWIGKRLGDLKTPGAIRTSWPLLAQWPRTTL